MSFEKKKKESVESLASIGSNLDETKNILCAVGAVGEAINPFVPLIRAVTLVISEIMIVYETIQYNKKICDSLMDRINAAEAAIKTLKRRQTENEKNFRNQEYYKSFIRFVNIMERIKAFMVDVSDLNKYQKFLHSGLVKSTFNSLSKDFDKVMTELHFTMAVANDEQRRIDQFALESNIADMTKFLERIGGGIIDQNQKINTVLHEVSLMKEILDHSDSSDKNIKADKIKSTELNDPLKSKPTDRRGRNSQIIKKIYKNFEVACKPIDLQNVDPKEAAKIQEHLAILGKLRESPNIIRFYGLSYTENSDVMVFEWAEHGSLKELYCKFDIAWHVKVQIALGICRGLAFLHSCDILHHDIRCDNIMPYHRQKRATDTDIIRWMAPEKLLDDHVPYTFKCEIFSFGMLLWELVFEKIPYEKWDILKIKEHVLAGNREKITWGKALPDVQKLQKGLAKIIVSTWQGNPEIRATLQNIFINLDRLANKYCTDKETAVRLFPDKELDLDGCAVSIMDEDGLDLPDMDTDFNLDAITQIIPLEEGIAAHRKKEYAKAWDCFLAHTDLDNATAKYWKGRYLWEGIQVEKDRKQARELYKEAADNEIADAQLRYAFSFVDNPLVKFDREIFLKYITKAADNNNPTAQFNLGDVYLHGQLEHKKDVELGKKYLRLAALNNQPDAKDLLQKLENNVYSQLDNPQEKPKLIENPELIENPKLIGKPIINSAVFVKATIMLGTTETADLENLLLEQKDAIENILKSQPVHAVGPNFQQDYSIPCITCYVSKPLETQVLENLSELFNHNYEIVEQMVEPMEEDTSGSNDNHSDPSNGNISNELSDGDMEKGNDDNESDGSEGGNGDGSGDGDGDGGGGGGGDGGEGGDGSGKGKRKFLNVLSVAKVMYKEYFQSFNMNVELWANVGHDDQFLPSPPKNTLEFIVNLTSCGVGQMLNEKCQEIQNFVGYYIDSVEIGVSPIPDNPKDKSVRILSKSEYKKHTFVERSIGKENILGANLNVGKNPGATVSYNARNNESIKSTTDDWYMKYSLCPIEGVKWLYRYSAQELDKAFENQQTLPSLSNSGDWRFKNHVKGFSVTIKQVLNCQINNPRLSFFNKSLVIKCTKMVHTLEITFNDLENFNKGFTELREKIYHEFGTPELELGTKNLDPSIFEDRCNNNSMTTGFKLKLEKKK
ncbi:hypothetical protein Glove_168g253 [Diversispora epigaea]|uniref:Protein kinase domain-containing protein n=1 Tax=Diversispora epigaea TaxID=1348612 RepID=A0A397IQ43_9GLOM|nr:hypothetical protein Glove_168g253 [Diversispora epigaea]